MRAACSASQLTKSQTFPCEFICSLPLLLRVLTFDSAKWLSEEAAGQIIVIWSCYKLGSIEASQSQNLAAAWENCLKNISDEGNSPPKLHCLAVFWVLSSWLSRGGLGGPQTNWWLTTGPMFIWLTTAAHMTVWFSLGNVSERVLVCNTGAAMCDNNIQADMHWYIMVIFESESQTVENTK